MRFTLSWLKDYVDFDASPEELAERLTMSGLEVETLEYLGKGLEEIVIAQILDLSPHPNAPKLLLCVVSDGTNNYKIVCGAKNMGVSDKVALAKPGTRLPKSVKFPEGITIESSRIRGELSEGMLCSEIELGIGDYDEGIIVLPEPSEVGSTIVKPLGLDDVVLEIGVTPNRPDCLSVIGIAREVAAAFGSEVKYPKFRLLEDGDEIDRLAAVDVLDSEGCPRYSCRVITDVNIAPSPNWLKTRLENSGIRSINNIVDVTNFVLLEWGQPLHAFDYDLMEGHKIIVRSANEGEVIQTLDGLERALTNEDLLICDASKPIAIAGVMGGASTEVSYTTRNILLESAFFSPVRVRRTSRRTNLKSESSYRFERQVDINGVIKALDRASELMRELAGGAVSSGAIDVYPSPVSRRKIKLSAKGLNDLLGTEIKPDEIRKIMERLDIEGKAAKGEELTFMIPTFRVDITREVDLIEELARHYGYNKIPTTLPSVVMKTEGLKIEKIIENRIKQILTSYGFLEVINYSFDDPEYLGLFNYTKPLQILNPLSNEGSVLRTSLFSGLMRNVSLNLNRQINDIRVFEIGRVYIPEGNGLPKEITKIVVAATGERQEELWEKAEFDFYDLKGVLERIFELHSLTKRLRFEQTRQVGFLHPGKSSRVLIQHEEIGFLGQLHPELLEKMDISQRVYVFEINLDKLAGYYIGEELQFRPIPRFPFVRRDIAIVVDEELPAGDIVGEIRRVESELIEDIGVFDVFKGGAVEKGKKSVAVSMILRATDKTLTDEDVNELQAKALERLNLAFGAELRKI
ncbi:MAG: phenylalanine--tRNA ligase subunit beta [Deltaproteobacteria bacterium]|nr:phenylalanine--tRNA ligase subunit beta [Deltaproteobacteria bacterium]